MSFVIFRLPSDTLQHDPTYRLAHGHSWQARARELFEPAALPEHRYLVRSMRPPTNMLAAQAVLKRASQLEHPRLWGPQHWRREGDRLWLATVRPAGEPLGMLAGELRRRGWASVVALWRPLVEAVASAHSRGVVHGQLTPWTVWYNQEAEQLTAIDAGCWIGDETPDVRAQAWWAPELRVAPAARHATPLADMWGAARLLMYMLFPEEEALAEAPDLAGVPAFAAPTLARALATELTRRPAQIEELLAATAPSLLEAYEGQVQSGEAQITSVHGARVAGLERLEHPKLGPGIKFFLNQHGKEGEGERRGAFFYEGVDPNVYDSVRWVWEGAQLHLLDAREVTDSKGRTFITSAEETLPVLEPTFPISVSDVLKAERCTSRFLVDERDAGETSKALVLGNLVHGLLADLTAGQPVDFARSFALRARALRLDMLAAGMSDKELETMERDARQHYDNLEQFTTGARADGKEAMAGLLRARGESSSVYTDSAPSWSGRHIEVTRYSPLYGLEGRIDLATEDGQEGVQIIELKSGSAWDGHLSQVRCYTLLWDGLAQQRGLKTRGYVLYSRYGRLAAAPTDDIRRERRILRARNELVACHRANVDPSYEYTPPHFMQVPRNCQSPACKFRRDRCKAQTEVLGLMADATPERATQPGGPWHGVEPELVRRAWRYWRHFTRLVEAERWNQHAALGAIFEPGRLAERVSAHNALEHARLVRVELDSNLITFEASGAQIMPAGSSVLAHRGDLHRGHILQGIVADSSPTHVTVRSQGAQIAATLESDGWVLDHLPTRIGTRQAHRALYQLMLQRDEALLRVLLDPMSEQASALMRAPAQAPSAATREETSGDRPRARRAVPSLNATQAEALRAALHAPRGALIQGPPGTGKTTVIAQIVRELVDRGQRVLVTAQTNTAVDTILAKVLDAGVHTFLRVGHESRSPELSSLIATQGANPALFFTDSLAEQAGSLRELGNALKECPVFGCTTHAATNSSALEYLQREYPSPIFDVVIVDEASQLTEPLILGPLCLAKRFVLVGDHLQLPPIVQSPQALSVFLDPMAAQTRYAADEVWPDEQPEVPEAPILADGAQVRTFSLPAELREIGVAGLDRSLFERLVTRLPHVMLEEQYRMNAAIMAFSNREFYGGKLRAHQDVSDHALRFTPGYLEAQPPMMQSIYDPSAPVVFVDVDGADEARSNMAEALALVDTLIPLIRPETFLHGGAHGPKPSVGVISPFRAQVQLIRQLLFQRLGHAAQRVEVDTVERYQGGERDIILVSLVKTERTGEFLADTRRLNVTLTRARKKLVIFGHKPCLSLSPLYRLLIEQPETRQVRFL
jgi:DNA replication ATP-dependent helicase Dna2